MKTRLIILSTALFALCIVTTACGSFDKYVPAITAQTLRITETGKFTASTVEAENLRREGGEVKADKVHVRHSNAWVPLIDFEATGYSRKLKANE